MASRSSRKSLPYSWMVLGSFGLVVTAWALLSSGEAQEANPPQNQQAGVNHTRYQVVEVVELALQKEIDVQNLQLKMKLDSLESLQKTLTDAKADQKQIDAVKQLIAKEKQEHADRVKKLTAWAAAEKRAPKAAAENAAENEIDEEFEEIAKAIGSLDQSFTISPIKSGNASTSGGKFVDKEDASKEKPEVRLKKLQDDVERLIKRVTDARAEKPAK